MKKEPTKKQRAQQSRFKACVKESKKVKRETLTKQSYKQLMGECLRN